MQETQDRIAYLFQQYFAGSFTAEERQELFDLINSNDNDAAIRAQMDRAWQQYVPGEDIPRNWSRDLFDQIVSADTAVERHPKTVGFFRTRWIRYAAAAAILLIAGIGILQLNERNNTIETTQSTTVATAPIDKAPGGQRAMLTLADGSTISLDSASEGLLIKQGGTSVEKLKNGQIVYLPTPSKSSKALLYNTMSTPRGGQYQLKLPDGTMIWLNAASSITYPTAFIGDKREVSVTGEVYFEVVPNAKMPFIVKIGDEAAVEVLGTHFNINAYPDESFMRASLLEGSVRVISSPATASQASGPAKEIHKQTLPENAVILKPGQQAVAKEKIQIIKNIDAEQVIAWKNGVFNFNRLPLKDAMRQLARWYDVEIVYSDNLPMIDFYGKMGRDLNLGQVLKGLGGLGVTFRMEGKKLTVSR